MPIPQGDIAEGSRARGSTILGLGITQIIGWGTTFYPPAVLAGAMAADLRLSSEAVFAGVAVMMVVSGALQPLVGHWMDRQGARMSMAVGSVFNALSLLALAAVRGDVAFWAAWVALGAAIPLTLSAAAYTALAQVAGNGARRAISLLTLFSGLSSTVFFPLTHALGDAAGWRATYLVFGSLHLLICLPLHVAVLPAAAPARSTTHPSTGPAPPPARPAHRDRAFWILMGIVATTTVISAGLSLHIVNLFQAVGLDLGSAVIVASLTGPSQVVARLIEVAGSARYPAVYTGVVAAVFQLTSLVLLASGQHLWVLVAFTVLYGASNGLITIARNTIPLEFFGSSSYGKVSGYLTAPFSLMNSLAPFGVALILGHFGAMLTIFSAMAFATATLIGMLALLREWLAVHGRPA